MISRSLGSLSRRGILLAAMLVLTACTTPVNVSRVSADRVDRELTAYALFADEPSEVTKIILSRHDLVDEFDSSPDTALARLHQIYLGPAGTPHEVFALAELSFLHAKNTQSRPYYLASALYAYAFLFPDDHADIPGPFDRRFRQACDLYNRALTEGLKSADGREIEVHGGSYELPFGRLEVEFREDQLLWAGRQLEHFVPVAELQVEGLRNRYRIPGIGSPLAAAQRLVGEQHGFVVAPRLKVPATAVLRMKQLRQQLVQQGAVQASLDLYVTLDSTSIQIGERRVPLEIESTSFLAYTLAESPIWAREFKGFFMGDLATRVAKAQLGGLEPYRPGKMPVVFVHGTASSAGRWADMVNDLMNDARIRRRFQFWFFTYNTGNPILYSGMKLRHELAKAVAQIDPDHRDPSLQQMVIIGHSQGGLLTKLTSVETGDRLWNAFSTKPLGQMDLPDEDKALFQEAFFVHPVPSVRRVVFIATPHRGSFQALTWIGEFLASLVRLPGTLVTSLSDLTTKEKEALKLDTSRYSITAMGSGYGMRPDNPLMDELAKIPVAPGVAAHSIIAVQGAGPVEEGDDGVVKYRSAHLDGVVSEKVVRSGHSTQSHPETIEEVRRILLLHAAEHCNRTVPCENQVEAGLAVR